MRALLQRLARPETRFLLDRTVGELSARAAEMRREDYVTIVASLEADIAALRALRADLATLAQQDGHAAAGDQVTPQ